MWVKVSVSVLLLFLVLLKVDVSNVVQTLARADLILCLLSVFVAITALLVNTYKWQILLFGPGVQVTYFGLVRLSLIGAFYNVLLPGQIGGEVVKSVRLARAGVGTKRAALSVILDRATGLLALIVVGLIGAVMAPSVVGNSMWLLPWLFGLCMGLGLMSIVLITGRGLGALSSLRIFDQGIFRKLGHHMHDLKLESQGWSVLMKSLLLSILFQLVIVGTNYLFCLALAIPINFVQLMWVVAAVSLLQSLPISYAGIGVREGAFVYLLGLQGITESSALALSVLVFATQIFFAIVGGLVQFQELGQPNRKSIFPG
jgi:glycosyltransferase 2 family protein